MLNWLMQQGYPELLIKEYGEYFMVRQWAEENEPTKSA